MRMRMCVGALALSFVVSLAVLPAAVTRLVNDVRTLVNFDFSVAAYETR